MAILTTTWQHLAGLPELDIHTISEDWALTASLKAHWSLIAQDMGLPPSRWLDTGGDRMYSAVMYLRTWFDLDAPVGEDDTIQSHTSLVAKKSPHSLAVTKYTVNGELRGEAEFLTSLIKRQTRGSNKKFAKVRGIWTTPDYNTEAIDTLLDQHHAKKLTAATGSPDLVHQVNRIRDFNAADFLYFKNFVVIAKAAEWAQNRAAPPRLNATRNAWFFGNVEDGDDIHAHVARDGDAFATTLTDADGRLLFCSDGTAPTVDIKVR
ncbi:LnmK family bifunctional acyltransferase/decarboxylase [Sulfitobacter sp. HNIBRBA2951]|uniref:LnmK family bifunctional acyltransferase/decarboxylase n=1 Tax=Sulfitobacter aquimarinus TaxID=3158557 RepID=UPI0032E02954